MRFLILSALLAGFTQVTIPKNNPNGTWKAESGLAFELRLVGQDLRARMVPDSNPRYLEYTVDLKGTEEPNTYVGTGQFKARLQNGRECEFDTDWQIIVVAPDRILGVASQIIPDPETCEVIERGQLQVDMQRAK